MTQVLRVRLWSALACGHQLVQKGEYRPALEDEGLLELKCDGQRLKWQQSPLLQW